MKLPRQRKIVFLLAIALVAIVGGYLYLTSSSRVSRFASHMLRQTIGAVANIKSASFQWDGTLVLDEIELTVPELEGPGHRFFDAEQVFIHLNLWSLLRGGFEAESLNFVKPRVYITEDLDVGRFNYEFLRPRRGEEPFALPQYLPEIALRNGVVRFGIIEKGRYTYSDSIRIVGNLTSAPGKPSAYFFTLEQKIKDSVDPLLRGEFDLDRLTFELKLDNLAFESPHRNLLKQQWRKIWDLFEPKGDFSTIRVTYDPRQGLRAELAVRSVELSLPYWQLDSGIQVQSARFVVSDQSWPVDADRQAQVFIHDFRGKVEDINYVINGQISGFDQDAPFVLQIEPEGLFSDQTRHLVAMPEKMQNVFRRFQPSWHVRGLVTIARQEWGGPITYNGQLEVNGEMKFAKFLYPLKNIEGTVAVDDEEVRIGPLTGKGSTGASIVIQGTVGPPAGGEAVAAMVRAENVPIDDVLFEAMKPKPRKVARAFLDEMSYQRLLETGLIQARQERTQGRRDLDRFAAQNPQLFQEGERDPVPGELEVQLATLQSMVDRPVFDLGGFISSVTNVSREPGADTKFRAVTEINLAGTECLFQNWPYPVRITRGKLTIEPGRLTIQDIEGIGLTGGSIHLSGWVDLAERGFTPHLEVVARDLPIDELLIQSMPDQQGDWVRDLHATGTLNASGHVFRDDGGSIAFELDTRVRDASVRPYGRDLVLDKVIGHFTVRREGVEIHELVGRRDSSTIKISGTGDWRTDHTSVDLFIDAEQLVFDESLFGLIPCGSPGRQRVRDLFVRHRLEGSFTARITNRLQSSGRIYPIVVTPISLSFDRRGTRVAIGDMGGQLRIWPERLEFKDVAAKVDAGGFAISGTMDMDQPLEVAVTFDAQNDRFCPLTKAVLPERVLKTIEGLKLDGAYIIDGGRMRVRVDGNQDWEAQFDARMALQNAKALVGVPITQMNGELEIRAIAHSDDPYPQLKLEFNASRLLAEQRMVSPLSIQMVTNAQTNDLDIRQLTGRCYGGTLMGGGVVRLDGGGQYTIDLRIQDVALDPFIRAGERAESPPSATVNVGRDQPSGLFSASMTVEGMPHDPTSRRGRGNVRVSQARLYEVPLVLAVLQLLNLSLPTSTAFDNATVRFLVDADLVRFDHASFLAPNVEIVGSGTMQYQTRELDLLMFSRSPAGQTLGPLSELLNKFKDELACIRVTGTLGRPMARVDSFRGMRQSWEEVFGDESPSGQLFMGTSNTSSQ